jgi:hypothetical protein
VIFFKVDLAFASVIVGAGPGFFFIGEILSTTGSAWNWESCSPEKKGIQREWNRQKEHPAPHYLLEIAIAAATEGL